MASVFDSKVKSILFISKNSIILIEIKKNKIEFINKVDYKEISELSEILGLVDKNSNLAIIFDNSISKLYLFPEEYDKIDSVKNIIKENLTQYKYNFETIPGGSLVTLMDNTIYNILKDALVKNKLFGSFNITHLFGILLEKFIKEESKDSNLIYYDYNDDKLYVFIKDNYILAEQGEKINSLVQYNSINDLISHQEAKIFTKENYIYSASFSKTQEIIKELSDIGLVVFPYMRYKLSNYSFPHEFKFKIDFNEIFPLIYAFDYGYVCNLTLFSYSEKTENIKRKQFSNLMLKNFIIPIVLITVLFSITKFYNLTNFFYKEKSFNVDEIRHLIEKTLKGEQLIYKKGNNYYLYLVKIDNEPAYRFVNKALALAYRDAFPDKKIVIIEEYYEGDKLIKSTEIVK